jgi:multisubunit Na+/H+ antiporter MnhB subunit
MSATSRQSPASRVVVGALALGLLAALWWAVLALPEEPSGLTGPATQRLPESGVTNPVTAVLLNYRAYDTLLELAVLLLAVAGVWSLRRGDWPSGDLRGRPLVSSLLRLVLPVMVLTAGYLLWVGASAPGGAFQGGAVLGGVFLLAQLAGLAVGARRHTGALRAGLALGVLTFAGAAAGAAALTGELLRYPPGAAGLWILGIEAAALVSIGLTLGALYLGGRPGADDHHA